MIEVPTWNLDGGEINHSLNIGDSVRKLLFASAGQDVEAVCNIHWECIQLQRQADIPPCVCRGELDKGYCSGFWAGSSEKAACLCTICTLKELLAVAVCVVCVFPTIQCY